MSGEIILIPVVYYGPGLVALAVAGASYLVADTLAPAAKDLAVTLWREGHEKAEQEKACLQEWLKHKQEQTDFMTAFQALETAVQTSEKRLATVELAAAVPQAQQATQGNVADYRMLKEAASPGEIMGKVLAKLGATVQGLPAEVRDHADFPYQRLLKQHERIAARFQRGEKIDLSEVDAFKQVISRTLDAFLQEAARRNEQQEAFSRRIEAALDQVLAYGYLATPPDDNELGIVRRQLMDLMKAPQMKLGQLELIEKKLQAIKLEIDKKVVNRAHRTALAESLTRNLTAMGYKKAVGFPEDMEQATVAARMEIPGGECLQISIKPDNQLGFEVIHAAKYGGKKLSKDKMANFRRQEQRWCNDFRQLLRQLVAEGFNYQIRLENPLSEEAVKVVVVETPDEILAQEEEDRFAREETKKRYLNE